MKAGLCRAGQAHTGRGRRGRKGERQHNSQKATTGGLSKHKKKCLKTRLAAPTGSGFLFVSCDYGRNNTEFVLRNVYYMSKEELKIKLF